jgi:carboxylesterase
MSDPILPGAEPWSVEGTNGHGALVLHGFTGNPSSMRPLAEALHAAGYTVDLPRLPGHGTSLDDMMKTGWADWSMAAEEALSALAARVDKVIVAGLSMGATLTTWLANRHPEIAGFAVINPYVEVPAESFIELITGLKDAGNEIIPAIGSDIAMPDMQENAYQGTPIEALLSLFAGVRELNGQLEKITMPALIITSKQDHVVPPTSSDLLEKAVAGPVERVLLEKSFHVATLDYEATEIEERIVTFADKVTAA